MLIRQVKAMVLRTGVSNCMQNAIEQSKVRGSSTNEQGASSMLNLGSRSAFELNHVLKIMPVTLHFGFLICELSASTTDNSEFL